MRELPSRKEFTRERPQMEMSPWPEQNKALFLQQAQWTHVIKPKVEHSLFLPKSHFISRPKQNKKTKTN